MLFIFKKKGYIEKYESELITNFLHGNKSMQMINNMTCSFERMILHGLCQYHTLDSRKIESTGDVAVQVVCRRTFLQAEQPQLLSDYLKNNFYNTGNQVICH